MAFTYIQLMQQLQALKKGLSSPSNLEKKEKLKPQISLIQRWLGKNLHSKTKKLATLMADLAANRQWQEAAHEALLLQSHHYRWKKGDKFLLVEDWDHPGIEKKIILDPANPLSEEIQQRMRKSKKMQLSLPHLEREIVKTEACRNLFLELLEQSKKLNTPEEIDLLLEHVKTRLSITYTSQTKKIESDTKKTKLPYHEYWSASGAKIWVGKKAADNDKVTFSLANGNDYWLHASGVPGSHVIIKCKSGEVLDDETLKDALQLALAHSKAQKLGESEIIFTQCKYVSRSGKGAPGKVQVSKHQRLFVRFSKEKFEKLKNRRHSPLEQ